MLVIYDSLTKQKREFVPITPKHVNLYVCGITVYDYCHIGHARSIVIFDMVTRYLRSQGYTVNYVHNITDIDDKIIRRAQENDEPWDQLTARFIKAMHEDEQALGIVPATHEPRATDYIPQIITLIESIMANGHAYVGDNGDVYFDVRSFEGYGKLSHRDIDALRSGTRVEIGESKQDPLDFVLWKLEKPGEPSWDSPWGKGRPGWHIECSAMSTSLLGQPFDIHGGGLDLKFPHHENEIAQSESACDKGFANYWMHGGLLQINKEKMSKSLGNFLTIREVLAEHHPEVIRYFLLSSHYRSPVSYSDDNLAQMKQGLERLYTAIRGLPLAEAPNDSPFEARFNAAMNDDFNMPEAFAVLFDLAREINRYRDDHQEADAAGHAALLTQLAGIFGLLNADPDTFLKGNTGDLDVADIESMIAERTAARAAKQWAKADEIRDALAAKGVAIEDVAGDTTWRRA